MGAETEALKIKRAILTNNDGSKSEEIGEYITSFDYYEDLLSPCVTGYLRIRNTTGLYNQLPIRSGERFDVELNTLIGGVFEFKDDNPLYVTAVNNYISVENTESFDLQVASKAAIDNEMLRCVKKYSNQAKISEHVETILKEILQIPEERLQHNVGTEDNPQYEPNIETAVNTYGFYGNLRKPFSVCTWLGPKAIPQAEGATNTSGEGETGEAKGVGGYFFFENYEGFWFKSIEGLVSKTTEPVGGSEKEIPVFAYTSVLEAGHLSSNTQKIIQYVLEKNTDLIKNLRVGLYSNQTYFFDAYTHQLDAFKYNMKEQLKNQLGTESDLGLPDFFTNVPSRILIRASDKGMFSDTIGENSGRENADMAKSFSRYNLLFTQSLNINVPLNTTLQIGQVIKVVLPAVESNTNKESKADESGSGIYLIRSLRHHFEVGKATTSLTLVRDSYGL